MLGTFLPDQSHPTALFLLELLLNHKAPIPIHYLYWASCHNNTNIISPYAFSFPVTGSALMEFIDFLHSFPSLFIVIGNYVYPAGSFDFDPPNLINSQMYPTPIYPCMESSAEVSSSTPNNSTILTPIQRKKIVDFFQNILLTWGSNLYFPIQRIFACLCHVNPLIRAAFPNTKALSSFLHQYPDVFHFRDGLVSLTRSKRLHKTMSPMEAGTDTQGQTSEGQSSSISEGLIIEVVISSSVDFKNTITLRLPASDFSVILVLRRILRPAGDIGLHVAIVIKELFAFSYDVGKVIGHTRFELYSFLEKYRQFFDTLSPPSSSIDSKTPHNRDSEKHYRTPNSFHVRINCESLNIKSRIIDFRRPSLIKKNSSKLDQHMGRVFRVAKSWGIIDLGNHVHVFFDKSIFHNVSDLQKVFQPNEFVYFDAIRAPLRSRAKWRAIRVWKPDDHDVLQNFQSNRLSEDEEITVTCFPFLLPSKHRRSTNKLHSARVESMPTLMRTSMESAEKSVDPPRRCCSLERMTSSNFSLKFDDDQESQQKFNQYSSFCAASDDDEDDDLNFNDLKLCCDTTDLDGFLSNDLFSSISKSEESPNFAHRYLLTVNHNIFDFDSLKRPLKLMHNTGGMLADLEFPESDISWTPELDSLSMASPSNSGIIDPDSTICYPSTTFKVKRNHASTQTCSIDDIVNST